MLPPAVLDLTRWVSEHYLVSWGATLRAALPSGLETRSRVVVRLTGPGHDAARGGRADLDFLTGVGAGGIGAGRAAASRCGGSGASHGGRPARASGGARRREGRAARAMAGAHGGASRRPAGAGAGPAARGAPWRPGGGHGRAGAGQACRFRSFAGRSRAAGWPRAGAPASPLRQRRPRSPRRRRASRTSNAPLSLRSPPISTCAALRSICSRG